MRWEAGPGIPRITLDEPVDAPARHAEALASFVSYCAARPELRFWQALLGWAHERYPERKINVIMTAASDTASDLAEDTFYWEG